VTGPPKRPRGAGIAQDFGAHRYIGGCICRAAPWDSAAAEASAPSFTLLLKMARAPRGFMTSKTKSVAMASELQANAAAFQCHHRGALHGR